jgi:hypothetical protein
LGHVEPVQIPHQNHALGRSCERLTIKLQKDEKWAELLRYRGGGANVGRTLDRELQGNYKLFFFTFRPPHAYYIAVSRAFIKVPHLTEFPPPAAPTFHHRNPITTALAYYVTFYNGQFSKNEI